MTAEGPKNSDEISLCVLRSILGLIEETTGMGKTLSRHMFSFKQSRSFELLRLAFELVFEAV